MNMEKNMVNMDRRLTTGGENIRTLKTEKNTYDRAMDDKTILDTCRKTGRHHCREYRDNAHPCYDPNYAKQTT